MERLTSREPRSSGLPGVSCAHFRGGDCEAVQGRCSDGCPWEEAAWERLAAYEDTGLEPCDYAAMRAMMDQAEEAKQQLSDVVSILGCSDINHLKELSQAEKDGRLVMLPDAKYTDADGEKALQKAMWVCGNTNNPVTRYTADAIAEKLCREARDENPPLTLEELREMDGEPVWVEDLLIPKCSCYHFVQKIGCHILLMEPRYYPAEDVMIPHYCANDENQGYQNTWLAYRRKPGEESG